MKQQHPSNKPSKFTVELEDYVCITQDLDLDDVIALVKKANKEDAVKIMAALTQKLNENVNVIPNAHYILEDMLKELMLCGEAAAIALLRYEMQKNGVQVVIGGAL